MLIISSSGMMGARAHYIGYCDSRRAAKTLYARAARSGTPGVRRVSLKAKSGQGARMRGVYSFRDKHQAFLWRDGVRVYVGLYRTKAAAAAAIRARQNDA